MTRVELIEDSCQLERLEPEWRRLGCEFPTPLLQFEWFLTCAETLYPRESLHVLSVCDGDQILAIAPLAKSRRDSTEWLEILGVGRLQEPAGLLYDSPDSCDLLLDAMMDAGRPLDLSRVSADSSLMPDWKIKFRRRGTWIRRPAADGVTLSLEGGWEGVHGRMTRSRRTDFRRLARRAEESGGFRLVVMQPGEDQVDAELARAAEIEASGWKSVTGTCLRDDPQLYEFFRRYCRRMAATRALHIYFLNLGEDAVAMHIAISFADSLWILKTGYDERFRRLSPGLVLALETIRHACESGLSRYEFLGAREPWQDLWPVESRHHGSLLFLPHSLQGIWATMNVARRIVRR